MGWTVSESLPTYRPSLSYGLEVADVEPLQELFAKYAGRAQDEAFDLAVRRFNSAYTRSNAEDRLIDYWVALEALFLPDTQEELSYRIALRLAAFCGDEGDSRIRYFDDARESYKARSRVIHGRAVARLDEITAATEQMVRVSLGRWIDPTRDHNPDFLEKFLLRNGSSE